MNIFLDVKWPNGSPRTPRLTAENYSNEKLPKLNGREKPKNLGKVVEPLPRQVLELAVLLLGSVWYPLGQEELKHKEGRRVQNVAVGQDNAANEGHEGHEDALLQEWERRRGDRERVEGWKERGAGKEGGREREKGPSLSLRELLQKRGAGGGFGREETLNGGD